MIRSGFTIGDKFVYFSKYGGITFGIVETIFPINSLESEMGVWVEKYIINKMYDSKEIYHYKSVMGKEEYADMIMKFKKITDIKQGISHESNK